MMRVAYVCADPGVPVFGRKGSSVHVQEVLRGLLRERTRIVLLAVRLGGPPPPGLEGVEVRELPRPSRGDAERRERASLVANWALLEELEDAGPFDLVYERYSLWSWAGMVYARNTGAAGLLEVNAPLVEEQAAHRELADREAALRVAARAFGAARSLLAVSTEVASYLEGFPGARGRIHVVPNAVDPERFRGNGVPHRDPGDPFTVGFVGSLKPWHGLPVLVEAFARLRRGHAGARLLVVGDGPERDALEGDLERRGLAGAASFTGSVAPEDVPGRLASMHVAVAPYVESRGVYFSPLKVFEYMAAGLPVVASRTGQVEHVIRDGLTGLLAPPGDPEALAQLLALLARDEGLRRGLGAQGRAYVLRNHTWASVARRILELAGPRGPEAAGILRATA